MTRGVLVETRSAHVHVTKLVSGAGFIYITLITYVIRKSSSVTKWRIHIYQVVSHVVKKMLLKREKRLELFLCSSLNRSWHDVFPGPITHI